ncbi:TPA: hypothetical protein HA265_08600 [Candidatus Woesearchaeota archaeon]|nr:hypothetical protein [Candidatus Woesearchaeota archaeon]
MRTTICALALAAFSSLFSPSSEASSSRLQTTPATNAATASSSPKKPAPGYDACFDVKYNGGKYIVTETMDQSTGIITSDIMPYHKYHGPPYKCNKGEGIHQRLVQLFP